MAKEKNIIGWINGELQFEGKYLNGKRNGKGKEYWSGGELRFDGEFLDAKKLKVTVYYKSSFYSTLRENF